MEPTGGQVMGDPGAAPREAASRANLYGLERDGLAGALAGLARRPVGPALRPFHAGQVYHWIYGRGVTDPAGMTDLPAALRGAIRERFRIAPPAIRETRDSADGSRKYVLELEDARTVEAVHMVHGGRITLCLSSQVGCALACRFCLTGTMGLVRNLGPGEIVGQVAAVASDRAVDLRSVRLVFMGMGEPLHNYEAVMAAFRILSDPRGFGIAPRRITLSTAGLVPGIERLSAESPRPRLAVSLTAARDALRDDLVPINRKHDLEHLMAACRRVPLAPRERITFEYVLLGDLNDSLAEAGRVARLVRGLRCKVNVIPYNETGIAGFRTPPAERAARFRDELLAHGVPASIRWSKGRDIGAACGQLVRPEGGAAEAG
jgi:23S rRNA (adenine2503-C2)-methyltransferase